MQLKIRTYQPGDDDIQVAIYNSVARSLPGFKRATPEDIQRRSQSKEFDPRLRFYAELDGKVAGYCMTQANGRMGYPWSLPDAHVEDALFNAALAGLRSLGLKRVFTAYRTDWPAQAAYFEKNGFQKTREMVNFAQSILDLPTMVIRRGLNVTTLKPDDLPTIADFTQGVVRVSAEQLKASIFSNPYINPASYFVLRRSDDTPQGVGVLINNSAYASPLQVDSAAPCFRLGAFGAEGMSAKRINGLYSFLVRDDRDATPIGLDLLSFVLNQLQDEEIDVLGAQVPSDARHLLGFYQKFFRKQGSFPIFERELS